MKPACGTPEQHEGLKVGPEAKEALKRYLKQHPARHTFHSAPMTIVFEDDPRRERPRRR
jgi:hypothetical protein